MRQNRVRHRLKLVPGIGRICFAAIATGLVVKAVGAAPRATAMAPIALPHVERVEVVANDAATGDGGNVWGGHQTRIVRTAQGLFTVYTVPGTDPLHRQWRLAQRTATGWQVVAQGASGREPANLLAAPDGQLFVIAWPDGLPQLWSSHPEQEQATGKLTFTAQAVPGAWNQSNWPYAAAGISLGGDLCLLQSSGEKPGQFLWTYRRVTEARWHFQQTPLDYRYCYTYVLPGTEGQLSFVSTRDVLWQTLNLKRPEQAFNYVFNAIKYWHSSDTLQAPLTELRINEARPTATYPDVLCNAQLDAYVDTQWRTHVLYTYRGDQTQGKQTVRHAVLEAGQVIKDVALPEQGGSFWRIIQDTKGRFYLLASQGLVFAATSEDGTALGAPVVMDLHGYAVEYSGITLAAPRCGVPLADWVDAAFPSGHEKQWIYFRLRLR